MPVTIWESLAAFFRSFGISCTGEMRESCVGIRSVRLWKARTKPVSTEEEGKKSWKRRDTNQQPTNTDAAKTLSFKEELKEKNHRIILQTCFDPEIPVNIYELGLIYTIGHR